MLKYLRKQPVPTVGKMIVYFVWMASENAKAYPFIIEACQGNSLLVSLYLFLNFFSSYVVFFSH